MRGTQAPTWWAESANSNSPSVQPGCGAGRRTGLVMSGVRIPPTGASQAPECPGWLRPVPPTPVRLLIAGASPAEVAVSAVGFDLPPPVEPFIIMIPPVTVVPVGIVDEAVPGAARHRRCGGERTGGKHQRDESLMHPPRSVRSNAESYLLLASSPLNSATPHRVPGRGA
jgi:hypothetical protein